jgi:Cyclic nucleotide-binding domain
LTVLVKRSSWCLLPSCSLPLTYPLFAALYFQSAIKCIQDTRLDAATLRSVAGFIEEKSYKTGDVIMTEKHKIPAALYLIRQGRVKLVSRARNETLGGMGYFGEETLLHDAETGKNGPSDSTEIDAPYSVEVLEDCRVGVLTLENCRKVFDTICKNVALVV